MSKELKMLLGIFVGTIMLIVIAAFVLSGGDKPASVSKELLVRESSWSVGPKDAKVTIVEFSDFECPACKAVEPTLEKLRQDYKDRIRFVYRLFPLPGHSQGMISAQAAQAAGQQGKFWEMHKKLFENQPNFQIDQLKQYGSEIGLDPEKFSSDLQSDSVIQFVLNDKADGTKIPIEATPTFFINGKKIVGALSFEAFKSEIDSQLK